MAIKVTEDRFHARSNISHRKLKREDVQRYSKNILDTYDVGKLNLMEWIKWFIVYDQVIVKKN